ncbi:LytR/AlgR family response regulator transcription factor [Catalinimonas niigatensis]|uniref:LytR/AlgR family response regulator transcription factor n=1 Tax=Catalinimonas niigatensis TaxID=1397264 RepID=UPI0026667343|nr:LytTR family DNA-binding domain-containing protein [Catalinimonas niigatensis]WPP50758.1 LytTR family DNA-binding domain-containing protein [Catalinimonas niigatensis]
MLSTIIVEDELHSREALKNLISEYCPEVSVQAVAASVKEGVELVNMLKPDLLLLDIALNQGTGFDLLKLVQKRTFDVIFTTAYEHYALRAIKFSAIDYLLKPIDLEELQISIRKVLAKQQTSSYNQQIDTLLCNLQNHNYRQHTITLTTSEGLLFVPVHEIIRLEAMGSYTQFHLINTKKILVSKHLKEYELLLRDADFYRIHQSHLINLNEVAKYVKSEGGYVVLKDQTRIKVSNSRKELFFSRMHYQARM